MQNLVPHLLDQSYTPVIILCLTLRRLVLILLGAALPVGKFPHPFVSCTRLLSALWLLALFHEIWAAKIIRISALLHTFACCKESIIYDFSCIVLYQQTILNALQMVKFSYHGIIQLSYDTTSLRFLHFHSQ